MNFFVHFLKNLKATGAVAPSSKFLAQNLSKPLKQRLGANHSNPLNILELGPGTGPLTKELVQLIRPQDKLDLVELQKGFYEMIQEKYTSDNVCIHHTDILNFNAEVKYDFIFSSLPYENMPLSVSKKIWHKKLSLCASESYISYFKYLNFRKFKYDFEQEIVEKYRCNKKIIVRNIPPAKLYTLHIDQDKPSPLAEAV